MLFLRKIGKLVRGQSAFQIYSACILGALVAFVPGFQQAPGMLVTWIAMLVVLNANLFLAAVVGLIGKLFYFLLLPVLFHFGVGLVDGPLQGLLAPVANAPVTAWFGLEYYVVTAGLVVAPIFGLLVAVPIHRQIIGIRRKLAHWEHDSESYRQWSTKRWVKVLAFVFIGGTQPAKGSWEAVIRQRWGNPIRPLGAALVILAGFLLWIAVQFFDTAILTAYTRSALEHANGATVDLGAVAFAPSEARLTLVDLEMADPEALTQNLFSARLLEADISGVSLLSRKIVIDRLQATDAEVGSDRRLPGQRIGPAPGEVAPPPETTEPDAYSIEEILAEAALWKERFGRIAEWVRKISPEAKPEDADRERNWRERLEQRAQLSGYAAIASDTLIRRSPRIEIREIIANGVRIRALPGERVDFEAHHLSTQPWLLEAAPRLVAAAQSDKFRLDFTGTGYSATAEAHTLAYYYRDLPASALADLLRDPERFPVKEGLFSVEGTGALEGIGLALPLSISLRDARIVIPGIEPVNVASMHLSASISGTIAAPAFRMDSSLFEDALRDAARGRLREEAQDRLEEALGAEATERMRRLLRGARSE